jgi:hypothetical protein
VFNGVVSHDANPRAFFTKVLITGLAARILLTRLLFPLSSKRETGKPGMSPGQSGRKGCEPESRKKKENLIIPAAN